MNSICLKYRILPTKAQETALNQTLEICREIYNSLINQRTALYEMYKQIFTLYSQQAELGKWKEAHPELKTIHSQVLQNVVVRVDLAFQAFFRRVKAGETPGYPRLKGSGVYDSITFPQADRTGCKLQGDMLRVSKIGSIKIIIHRPLIGTVKTCTIRRQAGKWFACFVCEYEPEALPESLESVGIDVGLEKHDEKALAKANRRQAKTKKQSAERKKANKVLSRIHERIRNRRHDFVHQLSRKLVNQYGLIAVEKLNVKGMVKNHHLAKSISDASWSMFRAALSYKAESAGRIIAEINPAYTSQTCSRCGNVAKKKLKERWHFCPMCSLSLDRDTNAAFNILQAAVGLHSVSG
jgi:putative transposase